MVGTSHKRPPLLIRVQRKSFSLTFTSPNIISTSPQNVLMSRLISQFFCNLNSSKKLTCPSGKLITEFTSPIGHYFLCTLEMQPLFWMTGFKFSIIFNLFLAATWYNGLIFVTLYVLLKKTVVYWLLLKNFIFTISLQTVIKAKGHENSESETCVKWTPLTSRHQQRSLGCRSNTGFSVKWSPRV